MCTTNFLENDHRTHIFAARGTRVVGNASEHGLSHLSSNISPKISRFPMFSISPLGAPPMVEILPTLCPCSCSSDVYSFPIFRPYERVPHLWCTSHNFSIQLCMSLEVLTFDIDISAAKNKVDPVKIQNQKNDRLKQWKAFQEQQNYGQDVLGS